MKHNLLEQKKDLSAEELSILDIELKRRKKSPTALWLLWLFTGTFGGHRYYLGDKSRAIAHTVVFLLAVILGFSIAGTADNAVEAMVYTPLAMFLFLSVPALWAVIDAFFIGRRLSYKNAEIEAQVINEIKKMRS